MSKNSTTKSADERSVSFSIGMRTVGGVVTVLMLAVVVVSGLLINEGFRAQVSGLLGMAEVVVGQIPPAFLAMALSFGLIIIMIQNIVRAWKAAPLTVENLDLRDTKAGAKSLNKNVSAFLGKLASFVWPRHIILNANPGLAALLFVLMFLYCPWQYPDPVTNLITVDHTMVAVLVILVIESVELFLQKFVPLLSTLEIIERVAYLGYCLLIDGVWAEFQTRRQRRQELAKEAADEARNKAHQEREAAKKKKATRKSADKKDDNPTRQSGSRTGTNLPLRGNVDENPSARGRGKSPVADAGDAGRQPVRSPFAPSTKEEPKDEPKPKAEAPAQPKPEAKAPAKSSEKSVNIPDEDKLAKHLAAKKADGMNLYKVVQSAGLNHDLPGSTANAGGNSRKPGRLAAALKNLVAEEGAEGLQRYLEAIEFAG